MEKEKERKNQKFFRGRVNESFVTTAWKKRRSTKRRANENVEKDKKFELYSVKPCGNLNGGRKKSIESSETEFLGWARKRDFYRRSKHSQRPEGARRRKKVTHEEDDVMGGLVENLQVPEG